LPLPVFLDDEPVAVHDLVISGFRLMLFVPSIMTMSLALYPSSSHSASARARPGRVAADAEVLRHVWRPVLIPPGLSAIPPAVSDGITDEHQFDRRIASNIKRMFCDDCRPRGQADVPREREVRRTARRLEQLRLRAARPGRPVGLQRDSE
jgi:hypothetical protein